MTVKEYYATLGRVGQDATRARGTTYNIPKGEPHAAALVQV